MSTEPPRPLVIVVTQAGVSPNTPTGPPELPEAQRNILAALAGRCLKLADLVDASGCKRRQTLAHLQHLADAGMIARLKVKNRTKGYFRPDAPPE